MNNEISILEIANGLLNKEFIFHYQPIVSLVSGQICGAEALIRWQKKDGDLIQPSQFIPLAENAGFISEITQEILSMVFQDLTRINESNKSISVPSIHLQETSPIHEYGTPVLATVSSARN